MNNEFTQHPIYTNYFVSRDGRYYYIKANGTQSEITRGTITKNKFGKPLCYEACVTVSKGVYKVLNVGRLVLETYVSLSSDDKPEVDHISKDPLDNTIDNLRWVSRSENLKNRVMPKNPWKDDRQAKRLATAQAMGYESWGDLLRAGRKKAKEERLKNEQTLSVQHDT